MAQTNRDSGLIRAVGAWGLSASVVNAVVGAGIFPLPSAMAAVLGSYAPVAFLICAAIIGAVAVCFAEGGSRIPTSGGPYGYIHEVFGPMAGYVAGTVLWFGCVLACGGVSAALADIAASLSPSRWQAPVHTATIIGVAGLIVLVNLQGVRHGARLVNAATSIKLIPLLIFVAAGVFAVRSENFASAAPVATGNLGRALLLALFAFTGMEVPLSASGEVERPERTIPRALLSSTLFIALLYIAIQVVSQGVLGPALPQSSVPLVDTMAKVSAPLRALMLAAAGISMFSWMGSDLLGSPRTLFAFARAGELPRFLARVHPRTHVPHAAILTYAAIAVALALTGTFVELAVLSTLASCALYIGGSVAAWVAARRGLALAGPPLNFRFLTFAMVIGTAGMLFMIALASRAEILGLLALIGLSATVYAIQTRSRSWAASQTASERA